MRVTRECLLRVMAAFCGNEFPINMFLVWQIKKKKKKKNPITKKKKNASTDLVVAPSWRRNDIPGMLMTRALQDFLAYCFCGDCQLDLSKRDDRHGVRTPSLRIEILKVKSSCDCGDTRLGLAMYIMFDDLLIDRADADCSPCLRCQVKPRLRKAWSTVLST